MSRAETAAILNRDRAAARTAVLHLQRMLRVEQDRAYQYCRPLMAACGLEQHVIEADRLSRWLAEVGHRYGPRIMEAQARLVQLEMAVPHDGYIEVRPIEYPGHYDAVLRQAMEKAA